MRNATRRTTKYNKKIDGTISQLRLLRYGKTQKQKFGTAIGKQVEIERAVKRMISGSESSMLTNYYILFAKKAVQLGKKHKGDTLTEELNILDDKWETRGLDTDLLTQIKQYFIPCYVGIPVVVTAGWEKIVDEQVTGAAVTSVDITGLDLDAGKVYQIILRITEASNNNTFISMFFNNDTTATNYYNEQVEGDGVGLAAERLNNARVCSVGALTETTAFVVLAREVGKPTAFFAGNLFEQSTIRIRFGAHSWVTENNVTRITFTAAHANAIGVGSRILIFKVA